MRRVLTVLRHAPEGDLAVLVTELVQVVRAEPFTEIEIDLRELLEQEDASPTAQYIPPQNTRPDSDRAHV